MFRPELHRGRSGPSLEGPHKCCGFGVPIQVCDLFESKIGFAQVLLRKVLSDRIAQVAEALISFAEKMTRTREDGYCVAFAVGAGSSRNCCTVRINSIRFFSIKME